MSTIPQRNIISLRSHALKFAGSWRWGCERAGAGALCYFSRAAACVRLVALSICHYHHHQLSIPALGSLRNHFPPCAAHAVKRAVCGF